MSVLRLRPLQNNRGWAGWEGEGNYVWRALFLELVPVLGFLAFL